MDDPHIVRRHAELVGDELAERLLQSLAMRRRTDTDLDMPGRIHGDLDPLVAGCDVHGPGCESRRAIARAFVENRKANAEVTALAKRAILALTKLGKPDSRGREIEGGPIGTLVIGEPGDALVGEGGN